MRQQTEVEKLALERGRARRHEFDRLRYTRVTDDLAGLARGTVLLPDGTILPGYPSIGRIQALASGLERRYRGPFWAEEKIDGFNVRILRHDGRIYGFTRGGFVCPLSTDRLPELLDPSIFDAEPDLVLCAEMAGPENPYLTGAPPRVTEDVALFVFDMMRLGQEGFLGQQEKMALLERHELPSTRIFGRYGHGDLPSLRELILELDAEGAEGLVFKGESDGGRAKYVTGNSNIADIEQTGEQLLDQPCAYYINRLLRLGLFACEHGRQHDEALQRRLGQAFLGSMERAIERSREHGRIGQRYRCRFRERRNAEHFIEHLSETGGRHIKLAPSTPRPMGDHWLLEFERIQDRMTGTLRYLLEGGTQFD